MDALLTPGAAPPLGCTSDRDSLEMFDSNPACRLTEREFMEHWSAARQPLRSFALRLCRDRTQADDLMQQTALQAWAARDRLSSVNNVIGWLVVILRNCHYEVLRRRKYEVDDPDGVIADGVATARAALEAGGKDNGAPGLRPHYDANYYAAFVIGPDGHNIEVVCHEPEA